MQVLCNLVRLEGEPLDSPPHVLHEVKYVWSDVCGETRVAVRRGIRWRERGQVA